MSNRNILKKLLSLIVSLLLAGIIILYSLVPTSSEEQDNSSIQLYDSSIYLADPSWRDHASVQATNFPLPPDPEHF